MHVSMLHACVCACIRVCIHVCVSDLCMLRGMERPYILPVGFAATDTSLCVPCTWIQVRMCMSQ